MQKAGTQGWECPCCAKELAVLLCTLGLEGSLESSPSSVTSSWLKFSSAISELQVPDCQTPLEAIICTEPPKQLPPFQTLLHWPSYIKPFKLSDYFFSLGWKEAQWDHNMGFGISREQDSGQNMICAVPCWSKWLTHWPDWELQGLKWWEYLQRNPKGLWGFGGKVSSWVGMFWMQTMPLD